MMLDIGAVIPTVLARMKKLPAGHGLDLRTYKRDRSVRVTRISTERYSVAEEGFEKQVFDTDFKGLRKLLKTLLKREFPRSNKVRVSETVEE